MARILLHSLVFPPDGNSTSNILSDLMLDLQAKGHRITVLTTHPHNNRDLDAGEKVLLELHNALDNAVLAAYGWSDLAGNLRTADGNAAGGAKDAVANTEVNSAMNAENTEAMNTETTNTEENAAAPAAAPAEAAPAGNKY